MSSIKNVLSFVPAYIGFQKGVGADRLRYAAIDAAAIRPGEVVVDVGCGPAYYFDRLRQPITYHGYDTDERCVRWSTKKYGDRGTFHHAVFDEKQAEALPALDVVLLLGLLHHLPDKQAHALLTLCAKHLTPGGRVVSIDPCFVPGQGRVSRWISESDRGEHVRKKIAFETLADDYFGSVESRVITDALRVPSAMLALKMSSPR